MSPATAEPRAGAGGLEILFAPDSFKGSLTSVQVGRALAVGWAVGRPGDTLEHAPLGDGGEGSIHAIAFAGGWEWIQARATGPLGRPVNAGWLRSDDGTRAFVELAEASGLSRVEPGSRDPIKASTRGTGELLQRALAAGIRRIVLGIGGSATTDGGLGILEALGARDDGTTVDLQELDPRLATVDLEIACDVSNPLLGASGAAATYGPQKGATPAQVAELDAPVGAMGRPARGGDWSPRARHAGRGRRRWDRVWAARHRRSVPLARAAAGGRSRHGRHRLRREAVPGRRRGHRRGPDRRADGVREDRPRCRPACRGGPRRRALPSVAA